MDDYYYSEEDEEEYSVGEDDEMEEDINMSMEEEPNESEDDDVAGMEQEDDEDLGFAELRPTLKKKYEVFDSDKVDGCRSECITELDTVLNIGEDSAARVLRRFKWDVNAANESWFQDEDKFRKELGILHQDQFIHELQQPRCLVCFEESDNLRHCGCGHCMCGDCWHGYLSAALESGPSVVDLRCFQQKCQVAVPKDLMLEVCDSSQKFRLQSYYRSSFVDENPCMSWCIGGGCQNVIYCTSSSASREGGMMDVTCTCGESFCFHCKSEAHRPVDCKTVVEWLKKAGAESENLNYILANTKPCPKCKRAIEKNQGCNHMVCSQCKHQFCWLCGEDWAKHGEGTGGYYSCNKYDAAKRKGDYDELEMKRQNARESLIRYTHYFERYTENDKGMKKSLESVDRYKNQDGIETLSEKLKMEANQVKFLLDSWLQVVNCRRVLKWTYAFGYYRFDGEDQGASQHGQQSSSSKLPPSPFDKKSSSQKKASTSVGGITQDFFEFLQGEAENNLERLHSVLEKDFADLNLEDFENNDENPAELAKMRDEFTRVKLDLVRLTDITKNYFLKLVRALERGVDTQELHTSSNIFAVNTPSQEFNNSIDFQIQDQYSNKSNDQQTNQNVSRQQKTTSRQSRSRSWRQSFGLQQQKSDKNQQQQQGQQQQQQQQQLSEDVIDLSGGNSEQLSQQELESIQGGWQCTQCTLINKLSADVCAVCLTERPPR